MMKKFKIFTLALAALALGACSSDDVVAPNNGGTGFNDDGKGYLKVAINLPTQKSNTTRANDNTEDGILSEYVVNNATLILFGGADEATATVKGAYDLNLSWNQDRDDDQITTQGSQTVSINSINATQIYALVVLNKNGILSVGTNNTLNVNGQKFEKTLADLTAVTVDNVSKFTSDGIFMTNAIVTASKGNVTGGTSQLLVPVTNKIYSTQREAENNPAADIFVERAVAKVELTATTGSLVVGSDELEYEITGWALANKNTSSYLVRNWNLIAPVTDDAKTLYGNGWFALESDGDGLTTKPQALTDNPFRFKGIDLIKEDEGNPESDFYRTYFGMSPLYDVVCTFTDAPADASGMTFNNPGAYQYCFEKTFDVPHQNVRNTTCAIVKAKFTLPTGDGWDGNFYIRDNNKGTIYSKAGMDNVVLAKAMELFSDDVETIFEGYLPEEGGSFTNITASAVTYEATNTAANNKVVASVTFTGTYAGDGTPTATTYQLTATQLGKLNDNITMTQYTNGESYYTVLIKHFGDDLTPWNEATKTTSLSYPGSYEKGANQWLGRYGVVRNNWYAIEVSGVNAIGDATVPNVNVDDTPDDKIRKYLNVKVNVLSWAKRTQKVTLE